MNLFIDDKLIRQKMDEYLSWLKRTGLVTDPQLLCNFSKVLHSYKTRRIFNAPGDAHVTTDTIEYCTEMIVGNMILYGEYYLDEVFFHEFTHLLNAFHKAYRGTNSFMIAKALENKMNSFTTGKLLEQSDRLLYSQDPYSGVVLLDEFVAQSVAQKIISQKYNLLDYNSKRKYSNNGLSSFAPRSYTTNICVPPLQIPTSLADYPEFDVCAEYFIKKYKLGSKDEFIKNSFNENYLKNIINNLDEEQAKEMYIDLCYMGLIEQRVAIKRGFITNNNYSDPVNYPEAIYQAFQRILKK